MSKREGWRPKVEAEPDFNPFRNPESTKVSPLETRELLDPEEDTAPLQGSKDLSDDDSLEDVIADKYSPLASAEDPRRTADSAQKIQGEGDYEAARRYREEVKQFLAKSDVDQLAREASPESAKQERELTLAEDVGKNRSKGDDPVDVGMMYPGRKIDASR